MAAILWEEFCSDHNIIQTSVPLFETLENVVTVTRHRNDQRLLLRRSAAMEKLVISEVSKVLADFHLGTEEYEGLIYMMFWRDGQQVIPLYIGKSEKYGTRGNNLSANIDGISSNKSKFCRWGDSYYYHIGDLSAVVCPNHFPDQLKPKYIKWARRLFESFPTSQPVLKYPTYFWIRAWRTCSIGAWKDLGTTRLTSLEYQLIAIASKCFPDYLLNEEGVNRC